MNYPPKIRSNLRKERLNKPHKSFLGFTCLLAADRLVLLKLSPPKIYINFDLTERYRDPLDDSDMNIFGCYTQVG